MQPGDVLERETRRQILLISNEAIKGKLLWMFLLIAFPVICEELSRASGKDMKNKDSWKRILYAFPRYLYFINFTYSL